jgi:hypothetical protein
MAPPITSFYHAIYKRLWAVGVRANAHTTIVQGDGNFSLNDPGPPHGIFGTTDYGNPLAIGVYDATQNPLWVILNASFNPPPGPDYLVNVPGSGMWPAMPWPAYAPYPLWDQYNNAPAGLRLIDKLKEWIEQNKQGDDTPKGQFLDFSYWKPGPPAYPGSPKNQILFVSSMDQDNGVRPGNVPAQYWNSARIYVCDPLGNDLNFPVFKAGDQRTIQALIGNSTADQWAGAAFASGGLPPVQVICNAYCFNTFLSDAVPLPEMSALDAPNAGFLYEQPVIGPLSYAVVGFRFDVDQVFQALHDKMTAHNYTPQQLGGNDVDGWLKANNAHACVKVLLQSGELGNPVWPTDQSLPSQDRHIAQRNLAGFDMSVVAMKKIKWQAFMMSQAGAGANALAIASAWPRDAGRFYLAVPTAMFERYVAPALGRQGGTRGFERVSDANKPFPDAVILRETAPGARLELLDHARERFFGMAFGVEGDPARLRSVHGDLSVVHTAHDGTIVGGFTLRPQRT